MVATFCEEVKKPNQTRPKTPGTGSTNLPKCLLHVKNQCSRRQVLHTAQIHAHRLQVPAEEPTGVSLFHDAVTQLFHSVKESLMASLSSMTFSAMPDPSALCILRCGFDLHLLKHGQQLRVLKILDQQAGPCVFQHLPGVPRRQANHGHSGSHTGPDPRCRVLRQNEMHEHAQTALPLVTDCFD